MNSFISWVGGKKALRKLIYTMFPVQFDRYIEVFGGGGWVLFGKPPDLKRKLEVYNDYNSNLANLFYCVKNRTCAFLLELGFLPINSRDEFSMIRTFLEKQEPDTTFLHEELALAKQNLSPPDYGEIRAILLENAQMTDVKRAAAFFKLIRYSYGSGCTSFGCQPFDVRKCFDTIWQASHRLSETVIENKDFEALIRQYDRDSAFFYCDPPYYETEGHYEVVFRKEDHMRLRDTLKACRGKWMVSYNDCDFIRELYDGYYITAVTRLNNLAQRYEGGCEFPEVIITNYDPKEMERSQPRQMHLFGLGEDYDDEDCYEITGVWPPEREAL
ncbi:MAG: DNA adenine methylase [Clostridium sp.]|nr:DNA adenine methylase [Clostridium sp.]